MNTINSGKIYTDKEMTYICKYNNDGTSTSTLAIKFNRAEKDIIRLIKKLANTPCHGYSNKYQFYCHQPLEDNTHNLIYLLPKRSNKCYTTKELIYICGNYRRGNVRCIAEQLDRSIGSIHRVIVKLKQEITSDNISKYEYYLNLYMRDNKLVSQVK